MGIRVAAVIPLLLVGCAQYATYGYQYRMQQQFTGGEEPEPAGRDARQLLASAKTVAFYPPDSCVNTDTGGDRKRLQELHASCGVLMSSLERAAEKAGYEVLSWQNLKGTKRAIEYAREANVDVLFEINEFDPQVLGDNDLQRTLAFFEQADAGTQSPLQVSTQMAQTCAQYAAQADPPKAAALTGTIDIKTVSVSDGRDRWHYRKTQQVSLNRSYPAVTFRAPKGPNKIAGPFIVAGGVALALGGSLALVEAASSDDPTTPTVNEKFDSGGWSTGLLISGAAAFAVGLAIQVGAGGSKPPPENVLCNGKLAVVQQPQVVQVGTLSAEHTFTETTHGDEVAAARKQIQDQMVAQFIQELTDSRAARAQAAPVAPPPAAPAPAPAPPNP